MVLRMLEKLLSALALAALMLAVASAPIRADDGGGGGRDCENTLLGCEGSGGCATTCGPAIYPGCGAGACNALVDCTGHTCKIILSSSECQCNNVP